MHKDLAEGRWFQLSLMDQLGNIGSEVGRAERAQGTDEHRFHQSVERALDLFDLTLEDARWRKQKRLREINRAREVFCDAIYGEKQYGTTLADLERYFMRFALAAAREKENSRKKEDEEVIKWTKRFIDKHRSALENLAKK